VLTSFKFPIGPDGAKQVFLDLGQWNFPHHKYMLGVYTHLIILVVGYFASFLFPKREVDDSLMIWGHGKEIRAATGAGGGSSES
jgi:SSS family solute:Na+ symporter